MATKQLVSSHVDGDYLHAAELENIIRAAGGYGVLTHSISATLTQGDLDITLPAFNYVAPDGSGGHTFVTYAGATLTGSAADDTNPRNDLIVGDASGNVTFRDGTATAETGDVEDAPLVTLASDEVAIAKVRREKNSTVILLTDISARAIDVSEQWPSKGTDIASAAALALPESGTYFDVTGTTGITSIESRPAGTVMTFQFDGILAITHNATSLILAGANDYTTAAGDVLRFISEGSGNWRELSRNVGETTIVKAADQTVNNSTTLVDDDDFSFTVLANTDYLVNMTLLLATNATADWRLSWTLTGMTFDWTVPFTKVTNDWSFRDGAANASAATISISTDASLTSTPWEAVFVIHSGSTGGTLKFQWAQGTSNLSNTQVLKNSLMAYRTLGAT